ncbi:hypothetical protein EBZ37_12750 [bacterium]|nr:hypothetical protein [bacterium]
MKTNQKLLWVSAATLILSISSLATPLFAAETTAKNGVDAKNFESRKTEILSKIDERMKKLQEHRNCMASAPDQEAIRKCRESMRELLEEKREGRQERHKRLRK